MDSYIQILCRFQKYKRKVPPPSLLNHPLPPKGRFFSSFGERNMRQYSALVLQTDAKTQLPFIIKISNSYLTPCEMLALLF